MESSQTKNRRESDPSIIIVNLYFTSEETEAQKLAQRYNIGKCQAGSRIQMY